MKRKPIYFLIIGIPLIIIMAIYGKPKIVPNAAIGQVKPLKFPPIKMMTATKDCLVFHIPGLYQDIPTPKPPKPEWLKRFTGDYREYSAECYADSTEELSGQLYFVWSDSLNGYFLDENDMHWIHREPTFTGFMDWLEEKYK